MSENNNDLNEVFEEEIDPTEVITVPIDATLSNSNEAADAKAVGDALALKADKSELQTAIQVNGQSADAQGKIIVTANDTAMSSTDQTTVKAAIETVDAKTGADIPIDSSVGAQTIKQAIQSGVTRAADQIPMSVSDPTTVKSAIETVAGGVETLGAAVTQLGNRTGADIPYKSGNQESIQQHVDALEAGKVKTVNEIGPDENGDIHVEKVAYADNLYTEDATEVNESFLIRTTGGDANLTDGFAWAQKILGNMVRTGHTAESIQKTVTPAPRTAPPAITASITEATFLTKVDNTTGTYTFTHNGTSWQLSSATVDLTEYGITVTNTPINGDEIDVVVAYSSGAYSATMTVDAVTRTAPAPITASVDRDTWVSYVANSGTYTFTYTTVWKLAGTEVDMADYGITITNEAIAGDEIVIVYVKEIRGTITVATPTALVATGWNLYDNTHGYARCVVYSNQYGYAISGTYTSIAWAATPEGETTALTPDSDGLFDVPGTGYIIVTGGNGTDTAIWATWSDWTDGYDGSWEAYSENTVSIASIMTAYFPYGLCKIGTGTTAVCDEIDLLHKQAINRISRVDYSDEARAAAEASGRQYTFDQTYIWQERETPTVNAITIDEKYTVSQHGLEWFAGSTLELYAEILYGANLKDKLRRDVVTVSPQTLTSGQKAQARTNIGAAGASETSEAILALQSKIGTVPSGKNLQGEIESNATDISAICQTITGTKNNAGHTINSGEYFIANGVKYKATAAIPNNEAWSSSATPVSDNDLINALNSNLTSLSEQIANYKVKRATGSYTVTSSKSAGAEIDAGAITSIFPTLPSSYNIVGIYVTNMSGLNCTVSQYISGGHLYIRFSASVSSGTVSFAIAYQTV